MFFHPRRLYAGFAGNLQEKVPLLMGFVSLSFFIILPVYAFFWYGQEKVQPFDKALHTVSIALLAAEVLAVWVLDFFYFCFCYYFDIVSEPYFITFGFAPYSYCYRTS